MRPRLTCLLLLLVAPSQSSGTQQQAAPLLQLPDRLSLRMDHADLQATDGSSASNQGSSGQRAGIAGHQPDRVSVVMLNWLRPRNVQKIISKYVEYEVVDEIIVWMCHPDTR